MAKVIAQKIGTFDFKNKTAETMDINAIVKVTNNKHLSDIKSTGDFIQCNNDGKFYTITQIKNIEFSFIDIKLEIIGESITEMLPQESVKLSNDKKLNDLGWKVM
ncbi:hypothetical protein QQG09_09055 [Melissococcus plutonius]|uniref:hypothetical protein n=1 Tax=Melissococcus plutonius TaxID=33970 RepID=UPI003C303EB3